jgi:hypothetical protein
MKLKVALEVARGTDMSIHKMGYACGVEDMRHRALDALLHAYENIRLMAAAETKYHDLLNVIDRMESQW